MDGFSEAVSVWSAIDALLRRPVTVAAIPIRATSGQGVDAARAQVVQRLRRVAGLTSGTVAATYDIVEGSDVVYVVGESIDAPTLRERVREIGLLSTSEACDLARHLLSAISEAHARDVIHGCINPSNVFVFADGSAKLAGLGWLCYDDDSPSPAEIPYVAPEILAGAPVGPPSDLWGLGAVLHFSVHGTSPRAVRIVDSLSNASPQLEALTAALLNEVPDRRLDATEVRTALSSIRQRGPRRSRPAPATTEVPAVADAAPPIETRRPHRRAWTTTALVAGVALLVLGAAAVASRRGESGTSPSPASTEFATANVTTGANTAPQASPSATAVPSTAASISRASATSPTGNAPAVPAGWVFYTDSATGYRIAKPESWTIRTVTAYRTDFVDPASSAFVRIEWTDKPGPDPVEAWRSQARSFAAQQQGYEELRIDPATFKGYPAAEWEFRYLDRGALRHALDLGMITGRYGAALFAVSSEATWQQLQPVLSTFRASFDPPA